VDGIKPSTVEALRVNARLDMIIEHIQMLIRMREEEGKRKPGIIIRYALMCANLEELPDAVHYWGKLGVDRIDCNYLSLCNDLDRQESLYFHQELMADVFNEARRAARHHPRLTLKLPRTIRQQAPQQYRPKKCVAPWDFVYICPDGRVLPCYCSWGTICMGNVYEADESFKDIWNNAQYQTLRRTVNNDTMEKYYAYCARCERRFGWSSLAAHLGDATWLEDLAPPEKARVIAHRRRKSKKTRQNFSDEP
jgi:radical SAM protein with 4Fe4S-binding SPASM domain